MTLYDVKTNEPVGYSPVPRETFLADYYGGYYRCDGAPGCTVTDDTREWRDDPAPTS